MENFSSNQSLSTATRRKLKIVAKTGFWLTALTIAVSVLYSITWDYHFYTGPVSDSAIGPLGIPCGFSVEDVQDPRFQTPFGILHHMKEAIGLLIQLTILGFFWSLIRNDDFFPPFAYRFILVLGIVLSLHMFFAEIALLDDDCQSHEPVEVTEEVTDKNDDEDAKYSLSMGVRLSDNSLPMIGVLLICLGLIMRISSEERKELALTV
jgi:hypothetical protein